MEQLVRKSDFSLRYLNCVHNDFGNIDDSTNNSDRDWVYDWDNGKLTDSLKKEEIGMFHLMESKRNPNFLIEDVHYGSAFSITKRGIVPR